MTTRCPATNNFMKSFAILFGSMTSREILVPVLQLLDRRIATVYLYVRLETGTELKWWFLHGPPKRRCLPRSLYKFDDF